MNNYVRITPEDFIEVVRNFYAMKAKGQCSDVNSIIVSQGTEKFSYTFNKKGKVELWSLTKPFLAILVGILIDKKEKLDGQSISLNTKVWPLIKPFIQLENLSNYKRLKDISFYHLLTHTSGFEHSLMFTNLTKKTNIDNLTNYIVNMAISNNPGECFKYTNAGGYLLSVIFQEYLKKPLDILIYDYFFEKIDVDDFSWNKIGNYCSGATGLNVSNEAIHKLGSIICFDGVYKNTKIVSKNWIDKMSFQHVHTPGVYDKTRVLPKYGYGLNMYICEDGTVYADDKKGQYLIVNRQHQYYITVTADQKMTKGVTDCLIPLLNKKPRGFEFGI